MSVRLDAFVVATPGLESLVQGELVKLGVKPANVTHGGVNCSLTWPQLWAVHLRSRFATRVLVRVARFKADGFDTLHRGLDRIEWSEWLPEGGVSVSASADKGSGLFHSGAVEERVAAHIGRGEGDQQVQVRVQSDVVTVSIDATGSALHKRGYRGPAAKAPMRETLAAALVAASGWDLKSPLVDPFCGSGTVLVEAAMMARRIAPGRLRAFQCHQWPSFDAAGWQRLVDGANSDVLDRCPPILGSDRDAGAVAATLENAARAGVGAQVSAEVRAASDLVLPRGGKKGWIVSNPPYGTRLSATPTVPGTGAGPSGKVGQIGRVGQVGDRTADAPRGGRPAEGLRGGRAPGGGDLRDLYARLGAVLLERAPGWHVALMVARDTPVQQTRLPFAPLEGSLATSNGGIPVTVRTAVVPVPSNG